ncbi:C40 family peptidase [Paenibacillus tianjinensis]|uniref:C40 family peptidase n=2 Tax=Paenibacillus tianjinensis TaxID=2810347 RepID=A0ABX7LLK2_9BACL|nr:C40 family peptidase [Paenibacillus tianjinensis]
MCFLWENILINIPNITPKQVFESCDRMTSVSQKTNEGKSIMKKNFAILLLSTSLAISIFGVQSTTSSAASYTSQESISTVRNSIISKGMTYLGTPYEFGSSRSNTRTFDCSDFVRQAYLEGAGITLPSNSRTQGAYIKSKGSYTTNWKSLKPGDIMFFMSYRGNKASDYQGINRNTARITHNGIYLGNGKILQTYSKKSGGVRIDTIEGTQWEKRFLFGGSVLRK